MPRLWWALTQDELPRPNGGLSKRIKYYILCLAYARFGGDALSRTYILSRTNIRKHTITWLHGFPNTS
jgi:hypothetical protein